MFPPRLWPWRDLEGPAFWALALLSLAPVWLFPYLPTQDGPAHLYNAQVLKDYANPTAGYEDVFELRHEPLPNLTSHLLLAGLLYLAGPLVAEKLLVSLYVLGFAGAFRYYLGAFGPRCLPLSWAGLLLVYNRCFWMGFYNYCLSVCLLWLILGYCLRRREFDLTNTAVLTLLFAAAYLTHLVGFLLAFAGAVLAGVLVPPRRVLTPVLIVLAALPAACLTMSYFEQTGFWSASPAVRLLRQPLAQFRADSVGRELDAIDQELLAHHAGSMLPVYLIFLVYGVLLAAFAAAQRRGRAEEPGAVGWCFPAVFGLLLFAAYVLVPNHLGPEHGGFLKSRLAPLPALAWLGCLREPIGRARHVVRALTVLLLAVNLTYVTRTVMAGNRELERYTAGIDAVGTGHRLFIIQPDPQPIPLVNPLLHAGHYYCLGTGNVNLDNYEAGTPHFPVKYRAGVGPGRNYWAVYARRDLADVILCWGASPGAVATVPRDWDEVFRRGPLRIYGRPSRAKTP